MSSIAYSQSQPPAHRASPATYTGPYLGPQYAQQQVNAGAQFGNTSDATQVSYYGHTGRPGQPGQDAARHTTPYNTSAYPPVQHQGYAPSYQQMASSGQAHAQVSSGYSSPQQPAYDARAHYPAVQHSQANVKTAQYAPPYDVYVAQDAAPPPSQWAQESRPAYPIQAPGQTGRSPSSNGHAKAHTSEPARAPPLVCAIPGCVYRAMVDQRTGEQTEYCSAAHMMEALHMRRMPPCATCGVQPRRTDSIYCSRTCQWAAMQRAVPSSATYQTSTGHASAPVVATATQDWGFR